MEQDIEEELINVSHLDHPHQAVQIATLQNGLEGRVQLMDSGQRLNNIKFNLT